MEIYKFEFNRAYIEATKMLVQSGIGRFPFSIAKPLRDCSDITLHTFGWAERHGIPRPVFGSGIAELHESCGRFTIFYDDTADLPQTRFAIAREWGRYELMHDLSADATEKNREKYEAEANLFAAQLLIPGQVVAEIEARGHTVDEAFLQTAFGVSPEAAKTRLVTKAIYPDYVRSNEARSFDSEMVRICGDFIANF